MGKIFIFSTILSLLLTGCASNGQGNITPSGDKENIVSSSGENENIIRSSGENVQNTNESASPLTNDFQLLKYMTDDENYMISPFSLKMAMMLAANGAENDTKSEILQGLNIKDLDEYNLSAKNLIEKYNSTKSVKLNVANSIWLNEDRAGKDVDFSDEYEDLVEKYYFGDAETEDANDIAREINEWIEEKTNGKIKKMLDDSRRADFLSVLVNTIYFKGEWQNQFEKSNTYKETFTDRKSSKSEIDFMHKTDRYSYYEDENMKMVRVPYKGNDLAMYFVLPTNEEKMDIESALDKMEISKVKLSIPKFKTEYKLSFVEILKDLGITTAFDVQNAEFKNKMFKGVKDDEKIWIDDVLQKTFIEVDENGTEAAAATAIIMKNTSAMPIEEEIKEFKADKPFIYFIMDEDTKEVLFMGEQAYAK